MSDEHIRRCKEDGKGPLGVCDKYQTKERIIEVSFDQFKEEFTNALQQTIALKELSADDFPSLKSTDESVWSNKKDQ